MKLLNKLKIIFKNKYKEKFKTISLSDFEQPPEVSYPSDIIEKDFIEIYQKCKPYTMTTIERMYSLYKATEYIIRNDILGDMVECGVWRGGSSMLMAHVLLKMGIMDRKIYLYDTYSGMTKPTDIDVRFNGEKAYERWLGNQDKDINKWAYAPFEEVKKNLFLTGYPKKNLIFVKGDVKNTIPNIMPNKISILRLDTDWYESTYHELYYLFPKLSIGGIIISDDYGAWKGAREAVDKYFKENNINILLNRIDQAGRIGIKCPQTF